MREGQRGNLGQQQGGSESVWKEGFVDYRAL